jgi:hypothetical protein
MKNILTVAMMFAGSTALSHTNSVGYVGDGNGGINFWYGSWHNNTQFNEAQIKITRPDGTTSIDAFDLLSQDSPAGLISGVNYFTSDGTQLQPYDPNTPHPLGLPVESYTWQGINYASLPTGQYLFTYIPLGDAESTLPGSPTADWVPMDEVIRSLSVTLTQDDIDGDANKNGILDINEVAVGAASGGPTVVSTGSSVAINYVATTSAAKQTVQRTSTTTTWNNMSDGSKSSLQVQSPVTLNTWSGRTDAVDQIIDIAKSQPNTQAQGIEVGTTSHKMNNGYSATTRTMKLGHSQLDEQLRLWSIQWSTDSTDQTHADSTTAATANRLRLRTAIPYAKFTLEPQIQMSTQTINSTRTVGTESVAAETVSRTTAARLTAAKTGNIINPYIAYTLTSDTVDAYTETGSAIIARTVSAVDRGTSYATIGIRTSYSNLDFELARAWDELNTATAIAAISQPVSDELALQVSAQMVSTDTAQSTYLTVGAEWNW